MPLSDKARLIRHRSHLKCRIARYEARLVEYAARLAGLEAQLQAIDPQLSLGAPQVRNRNPHFSRKELGCLLMGVLKEAQRPLPLPEIVLRVLAAKGHPMPPRTLRAFVNHRATAMLSNLRKRGVVERVAGMGWSLQI